MSKQPPPAPTASATGPCPTVITNEPKQKSHLGTTSNEITGGLVVCGRPTLALGSVFVHKTKQLRATKQNEQSSNEKKAGSWY